MNEILIYIVVFIVLLMPILIMHELGHYWGAKAAGVRVEEFGVGMPPRAIKLFTRGETEFTLNWLPLGAFVRLSGEDDPSDPRNFAAAKKRWRLITLAAGPFMNFIGAFLVFTGAYLFTYTRPTTYQFRVMAVNPGGIAELIGLRAGDMIVSVDGKPMTQSLVYSDVDDAAEQRMSHTILRDGTLAAAGKEAVFVVRRPSDPANLKSTASDVTLRAALPTDLNRDAPLGIRLAYEVTAAERVPFTFGQALGRAASDIGGIVNSIVNLPTEIARRGLSWEQARPTSVIGITQFGVTLIENRDIQGYFPFVWFAGLISFALGATNLLPLPALDGGRILFVLIEWIRGRRVDPVRQAWVHSVGLVVLLAFSVFIMVLDIVRPVVPMR